MKLRVLQVVAELDDVVWSLARALAAQGLDITLAAPRSAQTDPASLGMARRLSPLVLRWGSSDYSTTVYEDTLAGGRGRAIVLDPTTDTPDRMTAVCNALFELTRASDRNPDLIHAGVGAELMFDLAAELDAKPALVYDTPNVEDRAALLVESARCDHVVVPSRFAATAIGDGLECPLRGFMRGAAPTKPATTTKAAAKATLQRALGLPVRSRVPLVASLGPYDSAQLGALSRDQLANSDAQLVFLVIKSRDTKAPSLLGSVASHLPSRIAIRTVSSTSDASEISEQMVHAADFRLFGHAYRLPGANEMQAVESGAIPIAPRDAGFEELLADFDERTATGAGLLYTAGFAARAVARASAIYRSAAFLVLVRRARAIDASWSTVAMRYAEVYRAAIRNAKK